MWSVAIGCVRRATSRSSAMPPSNQAVFGGIGYVFSDRFEALAESVERIGSNLAWLAAALLGAYLAWKYVVGFFNRVAGVR